MRPIRPVELSEKWLKQDSRPRMDAEKTREFAGLGGLANHRKSDSCRRRTRKKPASDVLTGLIA
jgi:hypothetical protein